VAFRDQRRPSTAGAREDATRAHHRSDRLSPGARFDEVECTISHLLRFPHPALRGRRYGEALLQGLAARGIGPGRHGVLEIGGGKGHIAECALRGEVGPFRGVPWISVDLSPALLAAQARRLFAEDPGQVGHSHRPPGRFRGIRADAVALPIRKLDGLLLANEVIADLPVSDGRNTGAIELVREIGRVLVRGSAAVLVEFGGDFPPSPVELVASWGRGRHLEWTIDFRVLREVARGEGLDVMQIPLHALLGADLSVRCASYTDLWRLRRFARCQVFAAPAEDVRRRFPLLSRLLALELPPIGSPRWPDALAKGGFAQLFHALILRPTR
jgi:SAM-dependent methyltransferase